MSTMPLLMRAGARRSTARDRLPVLLKPGHELDEIARAVPIVELVLDDIVPAVAAGAGRAGKREEVGAAGDTGRGTALNGRADELLIVEPAEKLAEPGDLLVIKG